MPENFSRENELPQSETPNSFETHSIDTEQIKAEETRPSRPPEPLGVDVEKVEKEISEVRERKREREKLTEAEEIEETEEGPKGYPKEKAKDELIETAKKIEEAREKKEKEAENNLYEKAVEPYREITGENLKEISREKAKIEAEKEGLRLMTKQEFLSEKRIKDTEEKVKQREWSEAILYRWTGLSPEEKAKYVDESGKQNISKFAIELEEKRQGLAKEGINLSRDAYYQMMREGLEPDQMKVRGFWGRFFIGPAIEMPSLYRKGPLSMSKKELENWATDAEERSINHAKREARRELDQKVAEGQKRWKEKKHKCTRDLIGEVVQKTETERREKEEAKKKERPRGYPEKPKIELFKERGEKSQQIKEMERIRKQVETDIKKGKEARKKIQDLINKQKKNKLLTAKEIAYLNSFAEREEKQAA